MLAWAAGRGSGTGWVAAAVGTGQLAVGWSNDWLDRGRDARAERLDKPIVAGEIAAPVVAVGALLALALCVPLSLASGWRAGLLHLGAVAVALAYNAGLKATPWSPLPYALAFGALPAVVTLGLDGHRLPRVVFLATGALLGCGAHFVNAAPDVAADRAAGVLGLPQRLGARASIFVGAALLELAAVSCALGAGGPGRFLGLAVVTAGTIAVAVTATRGHERAAWTLTLLSALATVALFLTQGGALTG